MVPGGAPPPPGNAVRRWAQVFFPYRVTFDIRATLDTFPTTHSVHSRFAGTGTCQGKVAHRRSNFRGAASIVYRNVFLKCGGAVEARENQVVVRIEALRKGSGKRRTRAG